MGGLLNSFGFFSGGGSGSTIPSESMSYGVASGTNTYTVTLSPAITQYTTGLLISVKFTNSNTSSTVTLNCNSLGAKNIVGTNNASLPIGQINFNGTYYLLYDGTNFVLQAGLMDRKDNNYYKRVGTTAPERWYSTMVEGQTISTTSRNRNQFVAHPVVFPKSVTLDRIGMEITAGGDVGSLVRLGIYQDNGNVYPDGLVLDAGTINGNSATVQSIAIDQTLMAGLYWFVYVHNSAAAITFRGVNIMPTVIGLPSTIGTSTGNVIIDNATYGNLPSSFTSGITPSSQATPLITFRLSA